MRGWSKFLFVFITIVFFVSGYLYQFAGLKQYLAINKAISKLDGDRKINAMSEFYSVGKQDNIDSGTLALVNKTGKGGIWVWTNKGLKYMGSDEFTIYSYYNVCDLLVKHMDYSTPINIDDNARTIGTNIKTWSEEVKTGSFVQIVRTTEEMVGKYGNLREVLAYDIPLFLNIDIKKLCAN